MIIVNMHGIAVRGEGVEHGAWSMEQKGFTQQCKVVERVEKCNIVRIFAVHKLNISAAEMEIRLNNEPVTLEEESISLTRLLEVKKYTFKLRIVKVNGRFIERDNYDSETVRDGDDVQVVYLMSGG